MAHAKTKEWADNSGQLFDTLITDHKIKNDGALARELGVFAPCISKIRHGKLPVGPMLILAVHERLGMPVAEIRRLIAS